MATSSSSVVQTKAHNDINVQRPRDTRRNQGTVFYGRHHMQETILECLAWLAERNSLAAIQRVKGIREDTVLDWLREAAQHVEEIEALLLANYHLTRAQLDALWTYVGHKGEKGGRPEEENAAHSGEAPR